MEKKNEDKMNVYQWIITAIVVSIIFGMSSLFVYLDERSKEEVAKRNVAEFISKNIPKEQILVEGEYEIQSCFNVKFKNGVIIAVKATAE